MINDYRMYYCHLNAVWTGCCISSVQDEQTLDSENSKHEKTPLVQQAVPYSYTLQYLHTHKQTLRLKCRRHMFIIIFPILVINQYILWWQSIANKRVERVSSNCWSDRDLASSINCHVKCFFRDTGQKTFAITKTINEPCPLSNMEAHRLTMERPELKHLLRAVFGWSLE